MKHVRHVEFTVKNNKSIKTVVFPLVFDPATVKDQVRLRLNSNDRIVAFKLLDN